MNQLTFLQKSSDIKFSVLSSLENYYKNEAPLHKRGIHVRIAKIIDKAISEFQKEFDKQLPKSYCLENGISEHLYALEKSSGPSFFSSVKRIEFIENLVKNQKSELDSKNSISVSF